jgi:hypothetical protein
VQDVYNFLKGAWHVIKHPDEIIEKIRKAIGSMIDMAPERARQLAEKAITFSDPPKEHLVGIWRHLGPKLDYLAANWWEVLKQTAWDLLWPWPGVSKDLGEIWDHIQAAASDLWDLEFSTAADHLLAVWRGVNSLLNRLYGWIFIFSVLIGAAFGGGAGAVAGVKFAAAVGKWLLISTIGAETVSIGKAGLDLVFKKLTVEQREQNYEQVASSSVVLAIAGVLYAIGVLAARLASAIIERVAGRVWNLPAVRGRRGTISRGDVFEIRVRDALQVRGVLRYFKVNWLELTRRNFPGIDLAEDAVVTVTERPGRAPLYNVRGGRVVSVKSTSQVGDNAVTTIRTSIRKLGNFSGYKNVSITNPSQRILYVLALTAPDDAALASLRAYASRYQVTLEISTSNFLPDHPALVLPESIPYLFGEAGHKVADTVNDPKGSGHDEPAKEPEPAHATP